jgi:hypothetical protein
MTIEQIAKNRAVVPDQHEHVVVDDAPEQTTRDSSARDRLLANNHGICELRRGADCDLRATQIIKAPTGFYAPVCLACDNCAALARDGGQ